MLAAVRIVKTGAGEAGCHVVDEACPVEQILMACAFYTRLERAL